MLGKYSQPVLLLQVCGGKQVTFPTSDCISLKTLDMQPAGAVAVTFEGSSGVWGVAWCLTDEGCESGIGVLEQEWSGGGQGKA